MIFEDVRSRLDGRLTSVVRIAPCLSNGLSKRLRIMLDAWRYRKELTHVTGDIHFATILRRPSNTILTVLDCGDLVDRRDWKAAILKFVWFRLPVWRCSHVTTISEASKRDIIALTGCKSEKISVIGVAISDQFKRVDQPFNADRPRLLQVGTSINKNIERLAQAVSGLACDLVVIGKLSDSQRDALDSSGVAYENLVNISEDEMIHQYSLADVIVFASVFEGFGMPIVEGQVVGRPVVTSNCSSMPEVAGNGAYLVDPFDVASIREGIDRVIQDPSYRESLVEEGYKNARRFDADSIAEQYLVVYQQVAGQDPKELAANATA
jgi:glycosyltransferase involved in cell wall biosynthesis